MRYLCRFSLIKTVDTDLILQITSFTVYLTTDVTYFTRHDEQTISTIPQNSIHKSDYSVSVPQ